MTGNGGAVPANEWVHVAFSYDAAGTSGGLQKMYVNGVLGYSATAVGYTGVASYISKVGIFTGAIRYFNGEITNIQTWDRILGASEILSLGLATHYQTSNKVSLIQKEYINDGNLPNTKYIPSEFSEILENQEFIQETFRGDLLSIMKNLNNSDFSFISLESSSNISVSNKYCSMRAVCPPML